MPELNQAPLNLGNTTPIYAQVDTSKQPTIKVDAPKQPIYVVDQNLYSTPKGVDLVRGNKEKEVFKIDNKKEVFKIDNSPKKNWWQKQSKTAKTIYVSVGIIAVGLIGYLVYKKVSKK